MNGSWVQETSYSIFTFVLEQLTGGWSNLAWQWFSRFFGAPIAVLDDPLVQQLARVTVGMALGFLPVAIAVSATQETLARVEGNSNTPPEALIRRGLVAGAAVTGTSVAAWFLLALAEHARGVLAAVGLDINLLEQFFGLPTNPLATMIVLTGAFLIGALVLSIQRMVIAAEFTVLMVIGPLMAAGLIREGGQTTWNVWLRELISLLITPLIQMLVMLIFVRKWGSSAGLLEIGDRFASLAFLYVMWNTPRWARQMVYNVGAGSALIGGAASAGRMVVLRQVIRAAAKV